MADTKQQKVWSMPYMNKNKVSKQDPYNKQATRWWLKPHATGLQGISQQTV